MRSESEAEASDVVDVDWEERNAPIVTVTLLVSGGGTTPFDVVPVAKV